MKEEPAGRTGGITEDLPWSVGRRLLHAGEEGKRRAQIARDGLGGASIPL
jgi:hypothetical protein